MMDDDQWDRKVHHLVDGFSGVGPCIKIISLGSKVFSICAAQYISVCMLHKIRMHPCGDDQVPCVLAFGFLMQLKGATAMTMK
jgi:hypothetical protein